MHRIGIFLAATLALAVAAPKPFSNVLELDLSPEEAQKYLNSPPFTEPKLSGRTAVLPLIKFNDPRFRTAEAGPSLGHYWKNGHEIENTEDYVDEVYNARQFHGQDGLGAYVYGYETPESAKVENKVRSGEVTGTYTYKSPGLINPIQVRYRADSEGFHQEDNLPKVVLKPVEEAEDVKQARLAHEKAWAEAAAAAGKQPQLPANYWNPYANYQPSASEQQGSAFGDYQSAASEQLNSVVAAPGQVRQTRQGKSYYGQDQIGFSTTTTTTEEPTGPPRGFFYQFEYPVDIIVPKSELANPGYPVDADTVSVSGQRG